MDWNKSWSLIPIANMPSSYLSQVSKFNGPLPFNFLLHFKGWLLGP